MINDEEFNDSGIAETTPDLEVSLPVNALHIIISRVPGENQQYTTRLWFNRKVRRYYVMGLLHEALAMCAETSSEFIWCNDTPSIIEDEDGGNDGDEDGDDLSPHVVRR